MNSSQDESQYPSSPSTGTDNLVAPAIGPRIDNSLQLSPIMSDNSTIDSLADGVCQRVPPHLFRRQPQQQSEKSGSYLAGPLAEQPLHCWSHGSQSLAKRGPIHKIPVETLLEIFQLFGPPRIREDMYTLSRLTHVCRFWRTALINKPRAWATVFVTQGDRRSFVKMCLERSLPVPLEITMGIGESGKSHLLCTCGRDQHGRLLPSEINPCEWHFVFEILAETKHSKRIHILNVIFGLECFSLQRRERLALGSCQLLTLTPLELTSLGWNNGGIPYAGRIFPTALLSPTLRSLSFKWIWDGQLMGVNNLAVLKLENCVGELTAEAFRTLMLNNRSLETLSLEEIYLWGGSNKPPVHLTNLKSFSIAHCPENLSRLIHVPAFQRLSSLHITEECDRFIYHGTGDGIAFSIRDDPWSIARIWWKLTESARPAIHYIRLHSYPGRGNLINNRDGTVIPLFADVHTLEIGYLYTGYFHGGSMDDLKKLGPQLKVIRFELPPESLEGPDDYESPERRVLDDIEDLVRYRFKQGRPFSVVERVVTSESARSNKLQEHVWGRFYERLERYVLPE